MVLLNPPLDVYPPLLCLINQAPIIQNIQLRLCQDNGAQLIIDAAAEAVEKLRSLPAGHKETFASGFIDLTLKLHSRTDEFMASR
jgi:hypothetical protein